MEEKGKRERCILSERRSQRDIDQRKCDKGSQERIKEEWKWWMMQGTIRKKEKIPDTRIELYIYGLGSVQIVRGWKGGTEIPSGR